MQKEMKQTRYLMLDQPANGKQGRWMHLAYKGMAMLYQWAWRISPKKRDMAERQYKVSIGAIFKNEALYLKEWIEFHRIVGYELSQIKTGIVQMNILMLMSLLLPIVSIRETGMALSKE